MDNGFRIFALTLLSAAGLTGVFLSLVALFPTVIERTRQAIEDSPGQSFVLGLVNAVFLGALGVGLSALAEGVGFGLLQVPALILLTALAIMMTFGLGAMVYLLGQRSFADSSQTRQVIGGSVIATFGSLTPFIGWFALFPYLAAAGLGGFLLGWARRPRRSQGELKD